MARGIYFSGDLAAINDAMASEERNRIASRTANQGFLSNLAGQATARRGQDVTERVSNRQMDTERSIASERTGVLSKGLDNDFQAALAANAVKRQAVQVEADRIAALEREGIRVDSREKDRVRIASEDAEKQRNALTAIAIIQANAAQGAINPRMAQAAFEADEGVNAFNQTAKAAADLANRKAAENAKSWYLPRSFEYVSPDDADAAFNALTPDQQALVQLPVGGDFFTPRMQPRVRMPQQNATRGNAFLDLLPRLLGVTNAAPSVATPPIAQPTGPGDSMSPRLVNPMRPSTRSGRTVPVEDIFRGLRTNAVETPADRAMVPSFEPGVATNEPSIEALLQLLQSR